MMGLWCEKNTLSLMMGLWCEKNAGSAMMSLGIENTFFDYGLLAFGNPTDFIHMGVGCGKKKSWAFM